MIRLIRWLLYLIILVGLAYVVWFVPVGDQTIWQRIHEDSSTEPKNDTRSQNSSSPKPDEKTKGPPNDDQLEEQDRKALNDLIDSKLKEPDTKKRK